MTDVIAFRPKRVKQDLQRAFGNVSEKLAELIERELEGEGARDWRQVLDRPQPSVSDVDYANACNQSSFRGYQLAGFDLSPNSRFGGGA